MTDPFAPLWAYRQWIPVKLVRKPNGKLDKLPLDHRTGQVADAHNLAIWTDAGTALARVCELGLTNHVPGFVLTAADPFFVVDVDSARLPDGSWSQSAVALRAGLPNTVAEASVSGTGLHIWGQGQVPAHSAGNEPLGTEQGVLTSAALYTEKRFIALGHHAAGDMTQPCPTIAQVAANIFRPRAIGAAVDVPESGPSAEWNGPADDDELIAVALASRPTAAAVFGDGVAFRDLWSGNAQALAKRWPSPGRADGLTYDASSADAALAQHLAYWTGRDQARIARLMARSALAREKYERPDYLPRTIGTACQRQERVYSDRRATPAPAADATPAPSYPGRILPSDPLGTARALIAHSYTAQDACTLKAWQDAFYRWNGSAYREATTADVRSSVYSFIDAHGFADFRPNQARVSNVLDALRHADGVHLDSAFVAPGWLDGIERAPAGEIVACANGLVHLPTRSVHPPTPLFFNLNAVPYSFDPNAPTPSTWLQFLADAWPGDPDAIATLQEVAGYLLTPDTSQQKLFLIIGPRRSGKGTIGRVFAELLGGDANVAGPTLASLSTDFGLQPLMGKLVAIVSDARLGGRTDLAAVTENLLRVSGEDRVSVNRKFQTAATLKLGVRFLLMSNELPRLLDSSGALASRFVILQMRQSFYGREDPGLTARLLRELPGILNWAIEGWHRLKARGHFVAPASSREAAQELADLGSPVAAFVREVCDLGPAAAVGVDDLFSAWRMWNAQQGAAHVSTKQVFARDLRAAFPHIADRRARSGAERERQYVGIGLRSAVVRGP